MKLDGASGAPLWQRVFGPGDPLKVKVDTSGSVVVAELTGVAGFRDPVNNVYPEMRFAVARLRVADGGDYSTACGNGVQECGEQCGDGVLIEEGVPAPYVEIWEAVACALAGQALAIGALCAASWPPRRAAVNLLTLITLCRISARQGPDDWTAEAT